MAMFPASHLLAAVERAGRNASAALGEGDAATIAEFVKLAGTSPASSALLRHASRELDLLGATLAALERVGSGANASTSAGAHEGGAARAHADSSAIGADTELLVQLAVELAAFSASKADVVRWLRLASRAPGGGVGGDGGGSRGGGGIEGRGAVSAQLRARLLHAFARAIELSSHFPKEVFVFGTDSSRAGGLVCGAGDGKSWWPFGDGFCVALWCCLGGEGTGHAHVPADSSTRGHPTLFSFLTSDGHGVEAFFHQGFLVIDERHEARGSVAAGRSRAHFGFGFEPERWYFVAVEYNPNSSIRKQHSSISGGTSPSSTGVGGASEAPASVMRLWVDGAHVESLPFELMRIKSPLAFCCVGTSPPGSQAAAAAGEQSPSAASTLVGLVSGVYIFNSALGDGDIALLQQLGPDFVPSISADESGVVLDTLRGSDFSSKLWRCHHPSMVRANRCKSIASAKHDGDSRKDCVLIEGTAVVSRELIGDSMWGAAECGVVGVAIPLLIPCAVVLPSFGLVSFLVGIGGSATSFEESLSMATSILDILNATIHCHKRSQSAMRSCTSTFGCSFSELLAYVLRACVQTAVDVEARDAETGDGHEGPDRALREGPLEDAFVRRLFEFVDSALDCDASWAARDVIDDIIVPELHWASGAPSLLRKLLRGLITSTRKDTERIFRSVGGVVRLVDIATHIISAQRDVNASTRQLDDVLDIIEVSMASETSASLVNANLEALVSCLALSLRDPTSSVKAPKRQRLVSATCVLSLLSRLMQNPSRERRAMIASSLVSSGVLGVISEMLYSVLGGAFEVDGCGEDAAGTAEEDVAAFGVEVTLTCSFRMVHDLVDSGVAISDDEMSVALASLRAAVLGVAPQALSPSVVESIVQVPRIQRGSASRSDLNEAAIKGFLRKKPNLALFFELVRMLLLCLDRLPPPALFAAANELEILCVDSDAVDDVCGSVFFPSRIITCVVKQRSRAATMSESDALIANRAVEALTGLLFMTMQHFLRSSSPPRLGRSPPNLECLIQTLTFEEDMLGDSGGETRGFIVGLKVELVMSAINLTLTEHAEWETSDADDRRGSMLHTHGAQLLALLQRIMYNDRGEFAKSSDGVATLPVLEGPGLKLGAHMSALIRAHIGKIYRFMDLICRATAEASTILESNAGSSDLDFGALNIDPMYLRSALGTLDRKQREDRARDGAEFSPGRASPTRVQVDVSHYTLSTLYGLFQMCLCLVASFCRSDTREPDAARTCNTRDAEGDHSLGCAIVHRSVLTLLQVQSSVDRSILASVILSVLFGAMDEVKHARTLVAKLSSLAREIFMGNVHSLSELCGCPLTKLQSRLLPDDEKKETETVVEDLPSQRVLWDEVFGGEVAERARSVFDEAFEDATATLFAAFPTTPRAEIVRRNLDIGEAEAHDRGLSWQKMLAEHADYFSSVASVLERQHARNDVALHECRLARLRTSEGLAELLKRQLEAGLLLAAREDGGVDDEGWELDTMETSTRQRLRLRRNYSVVQHRNARDKAEASASASVDNAAEQTKSVADVNRPLELSAVSVEQFKPARRDADDGGDDIGVHVDDDEGGYDGSESASASRTGTPASKTMSKRSALDVDGDIGPGSPSLDGLPSVAAASLRDDSTSKLRILADEHCERVTLAATTEGSFQVTTKYLIFNESRCPQDPQDEPGHVRHIWRIDKVGQIHSRRYLLRPTALEIFMLDRTSVFFDFTSPKSRLQVYRAIRSLSPPNLSSAYASTSSLRPDRILAASGLTARWVNREMSNFDYLMHLNTIAGRTYNDITQWPIFPWVVADYESESLDLTSATTYRDLSKPVGALSSDRHKKFLDRYRDLEQAADMTGLPPFHYGSHYSTSGSVIFYMIRVEPFTSLAVDLQGGQFDHADRLFSNVASTWRSCMTDMSDVKELTPEFYYQPAIFENTCNLDLGTTQSGERLGDVVLPPWAKSAHDFVSILRAALESDIVSGMLHEWIDLIFGYKQRGKEAALASNVFYYTTYEGAVELESIDDTDMRRAARDQIAFFGQTPSQLLKEPHPVRCAVEHAIATLPSATPGTVKRYDLLPPSSSRASGTSSVSSSSSSSSVGDEWDSGCASIALCEEKHALVVMSQDVGAREPVVLARHALHTNTPDDDGKPFLFRRDPSHLSRGVGQAILGGLKKAFRFGAAPSPRRGSTAHLPRRLSAPKHVLSKEDRTLAPAPFLIMDDCKHVMRGVSGRGVVQLLSIAAGSELKLVDSAEPHSLPVSALAKSRDGGVVLAASCDGTLSVWSVYGLKAGPRSSAVGDGARSSTPNHHVESALQAETAQSRFMEALIKDWSEAKYRQEAVDSSLRGVRSAAHGSAPRKAGNGKPAAAAAASEKSAAKKSTDKSMKKQMQRKLLGPLSLVRGHRGAVVACALDVDMDLAVSCSMETGTALSSIKDGRVLRVLSGVTGERVAIMRSGYVVVWSCRTRQLVSCSINGDVVARRDLGDRFGDVVDVQTTSDGLYVIAGTKPAVLVMYGCELRPLHEIPIGDNAGDDGLAAFLLDELETTLVVYTRHRALRVFNDPVVSAKFITRGLEAGWGGIL